MDILHSTPRILIVDADEPARSAMSGLLTQEGYFCRTANSAEMAIHVAASMEIQLVITDLNMPGRDGFWLLEKFKERFPDVVVIIISGDGDTEAAVDSLRRGAADYLVKPPRMTNLIRAIERALAKRRIEMARRRYQWRLERTVRERTTELQVAVEKIGTTYQNTLLALVAALDAREHETSNHSQRVVRYTVAIAETMKFGREELEELGRGALLHDIGKIGVRDSVLLKPERLTPAEWAEMRQHPTIGHQMIQGIPFLSIPAKIVLSHQERWDSTGYPRGLRGQEIPIGARIFAVADTLDAMTSDRPYRRGVSLSNAIAEIERCSNSQFDPEVVRAFLAIGEKGLLQLRAEMDAAPGQTAPSAPPTHQDFVQLTSAEAEDLFIRMARSQRRHQESQLQ